MRCWLQAARVSVIQAGGSEWRGGEEFSFVSSPLRAFLELLADVGLFILIRTTGEGFSGAPGAENDKRRPTCSDLR